MNGIDFILSQSNVKPLPSPPVTTPPGGGKLSLSQTAEIICRYQNGEKMTALGREFGVSQAAVWYVINKTRKQSQRKPVP